MIKRDKNTQLRKITPFILSMIFLVCSACGKDSSVSQGNDQDTSRVSHLAGPLGGPGRADGSGKEARFFYPTEFASDGSSVYVADTYNHTIRRIDRGTAKVSTLAGHAGVAGFSDGTGSSARFNTPRGMVVDGDNLIVADAKNHVLRQIVIETGVVTTLAGSPGVTGSADGTSDDARFNFPSALVLVGDNLYVDDFFNGSIRKVNLRTRQVTTVATPSTALDIEGAGMLRCTAGNSMATDGVNLYITAAGAFTIKKVRLLDGLVSTMACIDIHTDRAVELLGLNGLTTDGEFLYAVEKAPGTIRKIHIETGLTMDFAGMMFRSGSADGTGSEARFFEPHGILWTGDTLLLADSGNHTVRQINRDTGQVVTLWGEAGGMAGSTDGIGGLARFDQPVGMASDSKNMYVADSKNHTIRKIVLATRAVSTFAGKAGDSGSTDGPGADARFNRPQGMATDGENLYVADAGNCTIRKIHIQSGAVSTIAGQPYNEGFSDGVGPLASFMFPFGMTTDGENLYITDISRCNIRKLEIRTGAVVTLAGSGHEGSADGVGTDAEFNFPAGITTDGTNLYVTDVANSTIRKIVIESGEVTTLAGTPGNRGVTDGLASEALFNYPSGIAIDGNDLFVTDTNNHTIRKISLATGMVSTLAGKAGELGSGDGDLLDSRFFSPFGILCDQINHIVYVTDVGNQSIRKVLPRQ